MKLRQKIALGLCSFYLISVTGIALNLHFCSDELSSVNFTKQTACNVCTSADNNKLVKTENTCQDSNSGTKAAKKDKSPAEVEGSKNYGVAVLFTPIIAEFLQDLVPGLFSRMRG